MFKRGLIHHRQLISDRSQPLDGVGNSRGVDKLVQLRSSVEVPGLPTPMQVHCFFHHSLRMSKIGTIHTDLKLFISSCFINISSLSKIIFIFGDKALQYTLYLQKLFCPDL